VPQAGQNTADLGIHSFQGQARGMLQLYLRKHGTYFMHHFACQAAGRIELFTILLTRRFAEEIIQTI
jgi:hypothetical protein